MSMPINNQPRNNIQPIYGYQMMPNNSGMPNMPNMPHYMNQSIPHHAKPNPIGYFGGPSSYPMTSHGFYPNMNQPQNQNNHGNPNFNGMGQMGYMSGQVGQYMGQ